MTGTDKTITCDLCGRQVPCTGDEKVYDASVPAARGSWAWMCPACFETCGATLGTGLGQEFRCEAGKWAKAAG